MSFNQNQNQNQNQSFGHGRGVSLASVPGNLGFHSLTLDFTPVPGHPKWPLDEIANPPPSFNPVLWDADLYALQILQEFVTTDWVLPATARPDWTAMTPPPADLGWQLGQPNTVAFIRAELSQLSVLMENDRDRYLAEIVAQADDASPWWLSMLGITQSSRPKTFRLISAALRLGEYVGMYFKNKYARARPSVLAPGLQPPFGPPGHPSFPNNHCLQGFLVTFCLEAVTPQVGGVSVYRDQLRWLAWRVGVNRERAGLHYPSDTRAGRSFAHELFNTYLNDWPLIGGNPSRFTALMTAAAADEWP